MIRDYWKSVGDKIGFLIQALFREHVFFSENFRQNFLRNYLPRYLPILLSFVLIKPVIKASNVSKMSVFANFCVKTLTVVGT